MMKEFSMHILDIVENSVKAQSPVVEIEVYEDVIHNKLSFYVLDKGIGIDEDMLSEIKNPFTTSRTSRKVGLGIPMLEQTCVMCGGSLDIKSRKGEGTIISATMEYDNIDKPPMGDISNTVYLLVVMHPDIDFKYIHRYNDKVYTLDTVEIKEILEGVPLTEPSVLAWLKENIIEGISEIRIGSN